MTDIINQKVSFEDDSNNALVIKREQAIPQSFLDRLKQERDDTQDRPMGDFHKFASIPVVVVEKWMKEGFNVFDKNVKHAEILKRLRDEHLDAFITTTKRI